MNPYHTYLQAKSIPENVTAALSQMQMKYNIELIANTLKLLHSEGIT
ncbi:MAG: hypothetical protein ABSH29_26565 [Acidimicrobiales bacterium]